MSHWNGKIPGFILKKKTHPGRFFLNFFKSARGDKSRENDATHDFGSDDDFKIWGFDKVNYEVQFAVLYSMYAQILPCTIPIMPQSIIQAYRSVHGDPETVLRLHKCYICQSSVKWEASRNRFYYVCSTFIQCCGSGCRI